MSVTDYLDKMKSIADALEAIAQPVIEYDLRNKILNGLGPEYDSFHTSIANRETPISFEELFGQLLTFELRLELHHSTPTIEQPVTALYTTTTTQGRSNSRERSDNRGRGHGRQNARGGSSHKPNPSQSNKSAQSSF